MHCWRSTTSPATYVKALCRATTKSGFPSLKTSLALAWTQSHIPFLVSSLKTVKPLSPVFITGQTRELGASNTLKVYLNQGSIKIQNCFENEFQLNLNCGGKQEAELQLKFKLQKVQLKFKEIHHAELKCI